MKVHIRTVVQVYWPVSKPDPNNASADRFKFSIRHISAGFTLWLICSSLWDSSTIGTYVTSEQWEQYNYCNGAIFLSYSSSFYCAVRVQGNRQLVSFGWFVCFVKPMKSGDNLIDLVLNTLLCIAEERSIDWLIDNFNFEREMSMAARLAGPPGSSVHTHSTNNKGKKGKARKETI